MVVLFIKCRVRPLNQMTNPAHLSDVDGGLRERANLNRHCSRCAGCHGEVKVESLATSLVTFTSSSCVKIDRCNRAQVTVLAMPQYRKAGSCHRGDSYQG